MPLSRPSGPVNPRAYQEYANREIDYLARQGRITDPAAAKREAVGYAEQRRDLIPGTPEYVAAQKRAQAAAAKKAEDERAFKAAMAQQKPDDTDAYLKALQRAALDRELRRSGGTAGAFGGGGKVY